MNIRHRIRLVFPKFRWFVNLILRVKSEWKRLRTTLEIEEKKTQLEKDFIYHQRKNTDESLQRAYGIERQIEILDWILGGQNVV